MKKVIQLKSLALAALFFLPISASAQASPSPTCLILGDSIASGVHLSLRQKNIKCYVMAKKSMNTMWMARNAPFIVLTP